MPPLKLAILSRGTHIFQHGITTVSKKVLSISTYATQHKRTTQHAQPLEYLQFHIGYKNNPFKVILWNFKYFCTQINNLLI